MQETRPQTMATDQSKIIERNAKLAELETLLARYPYLTKQTLPGAQDAREFFSISQHGPPLKHLYPNTYHWYVLIRQFSKKSLVKWMQNEHTEQVSPKINSRRIKTTRQFRESPQQTTQPSNYCSAEEYKEDIKHSFASDTTIPTRSGLASMVSLQSSKAFTTNKQEPIKKHNSSNVEVVESNEHPKQPKIDLKFSAGSEKFLKPIVAIPEDEGVSLPGTKTANKSHTSQEHRVRQLDLIEDRT